MASGGVVLEQIVNLCSLKILQRSIKRFFIVLLAAFGSLTLTGCLQTGDENVNTDLFKGNGDFQQRAQILKPGLSKSQAFEVLGVSESKFERLGTAGIQIALYGNSQVQGTPEQLEQFRERLSSYEGYSLPYRDIKSNSSLGFGTMKVHKSGEDLRAILIFSNDKLLRVSFEGTQEVSEDRSQSLWGTIISKGIGFAF